eukprot:scaffold4416_cov65-Phaeocystis_antarctica.AAC.5
MIRVGALFTGQRCACPQRAEVARLAGNTRLLALVGLVLACRALVARALAGAESNGAGAAGRLHGASRWREVARGGLRALAAAGEVGGAGVRAFLARQRCAGTLRAVRAGLAGDARVLALVGVVLRWRRWRRHRCGGGRRRRRRRRWHRRGGGRRRRRRRRRHRRGGGGLVTGLVAGPGLVAAHPGQLFRNVGGGLVRTGCAPVARTLACDGLDGARATHGLLGAARWREVARGGLRAPTAACEVGGAGVRALFARQRRAGTL